MQCSSGSCSSGCGSHVVACPCPEEGNPEIDSLEKVVNCFWQNHQGLAVERDYYESLDSLAAAIDEAVEALDDANLGYDLPDVVPASVIRQAKENLRGREAALGGAESFDSLFELVERELGALDGITPSLIYLTALRIGLKAGLHPEKIYLRTGARDGSATLVELGAGQRDLARDRLPRIFQHPELTTEDVRLCLAICRHQLRWLGSE